MDVACGEEYDEAFLLELDAVEAAAVQHSRAQIGVVPAASNASNGTIEQRGHQRAAAQILPGSVMLEQGCSTGESSKPGDYHTEASNIVCLYRWAVENIFVQDDAAMQGSAEDRIGKVLWHTTREYHT